MVRAMKRDPLDTEPVCANTAGNWLDSVKKSFAELSKACYGPIIMVCVGHPIRSATSTSASSSLPEWTSSCRPATLGRSSDKIHRFYADVKLVLMKEHLWPEWRLPA